MTHAHTPTPTPAPAGMRYDHLHALIRQHPERYLWFGPYWWVIKRAMQNAGLHLGGHDEPGTRGLLERVNGGTAAAQRRAMQVYTNNTGAFRNHEFNLPNGDAYFLLDPDAPFA